MRRLDRPDDARDHDSHEPPSRGATLRSQTAKTSVKRWLMRTHKTLIPAWMVIESDSAAPGGTLDRIDALSRKPQSRVPAYGRSNREGHSRESGFMQSQGNQIIGNGDGAGSGVEDRKQRRQ